MVIGLSVAYETWPPVRWHHSFVIGWSKYGFGMTRVRMDCGLTWPVGISVSQKPLTVPLHSPTSRYLPGVSVVQGDCERVYYLWHYLIDASGSMTTNGSRPFDFHFLIKIFNFLPYGSWQGSIDTKLSLVEVMARCPEGTEPLSQSMMTEILGI